MSIRLAAVVLFATAIVPALQAQLVGPGLTWTGSAGGSAGSHLPSCTNLPVSAVRGETVSLRIWGDRGAPWALFAAAGANQCLPIPGFGNALVLDLPVLALGGGVLSRSSPCLVCPPGFEELRFTVPNGVPSGTSLSLQAASYGGRTLSFTVAVTGTVQ